MEVSVGFGLGVLLFASGLMYLEVRAWKVSKSAPSMSPRERDRRWRKFRRRMQVALLLALIGVMIPIGDLVLPLSRSPFWFAAYWGVVLLTTLWVVAIAIGDMLATAAHSRAAMMRIEIEQHRLQDELERLRNGHQSDRDSSDHATGA